MDKTLSKEECLQLDIVVYNMALELTLRKEGSSEILNTCKHCGRKYRVCCICEEAENRWDEMIKEVREVSEANNNDSANANEIQRISEILDELRLIKNTHEQGSKTRYLYTSICDKLDYLQNKLINGH